VAAPGVLLGPDCLLATIKARLRPHIGDGRADLAAATGALPHVTQPTKEVVMTAGSSDPRLELTLDDLRTLCAAVAIALPTINEVDRARYRALATKLKTILLRAQQVDQLWQAAGET
jgi:hypothetical protein